MRVILFANTSWYLYNFRSALALRLAAAGHDVLLVSPPGEYGDKLAGLGLRWHPVAMNRRSVNPLLEIVALWRIWKLFRRERPALVHNFTIKCAVYGSLAARLSGVPARINAIAGMGYVFTSRDFLARCLRPVVRGLMRLALGGRNACVVVQNSDDFALVRNAKLLPDDQIFLIRGSGVDCARFTPAEASNESGHFRVLLASRMLWDKGIGEYVSAARQLLSKHADMKFLLAGTPDFGNPASIPESTLRGWHQEGVVEWLGHVDDMPALFSRVDLVVLPSYREGLPKTLIEAGACGLPLVTTDAPGCREVIVDRESGLLIPPRDASALANAIEKVHASPELAKRYGEAARARVMSEFDQGSVNQQTLELYRRVECALT